MREYRGWSPRLACPASRHFADTLGAGKKGTQGRQRPRRPSIREPYTLLSQRLFGRPAPTFSVGLGFDSRLPCHSPCLWLSHIFQVSILPHFVSKRKYIIQFPVTLRPLSPHPACLVCCGSFLISMDSSYLKQPGPPVKMDPEGVELNLTRANNMGGYHSCPHSHLLSHLNHNLSLMLALLLPFKRTPTSPLGNLTPPGSCQGGPVRPKLSRPKLSGAPCPSEVVTPRRCQGVLSDRSCQVTTSWGGGSIFFLFLSFCRRFAPTDATQGPRPIRLPFPSLLPGGESVPCQGLRPHPSRPPDFWGRMSAAAYVTPLKLRITRFAQCGFVQRKRSFRWPLNLFL